MRLIYKIDVKSRLNKKAEELALLVKLYLGCMFTSEYDFDCMVDELRRFIASLNEKYPRTNAFCVYMVSKNGTYISDVRDCAKQIAYLYTTEVLNVYDKEEDSIVPIQEYIREKQ